MPDMDYRKLIGKIAEQGMTQKELASSIHLSESHFSQKIQGKYPFKQSEINAICDCLAINKGEIGEYFFTPKVDIPKHQEADA